MQYTNPAFKLALATCALATVFQLTFNSEVRAQEASFTVGLIEGRPLPSIQVATEIASPNGHPVLLAAYLGAWNSWGRDEPECRDCNLFDTNNLWTGVRLVKSVSTLPFRIGFGMGIQHQLQWRQLYQSGGVRSHPNTIVTDFGIELLMTADIRISPRVLLTGSFNATVKKVLLPISRPIGQFNIGATYLLGMNR